MKTNMGTIDRSMRTLVALVLIILYYQGIISGTFLTIGLLISAVFLITSIIGFCPLYTLFGFSTCKTKQ
ncbi:MAG TPA: DUF2892 domain-containing protein [Bacteroidia bacterium]|nr:DUF2892 domain-containing protein [Bacteroidia bacterium]HNT79638.1 DUF2892 domain-containing protein [Bacteroidia bacterium]